MKTLLSILLMFSVANGQGKTAPQQGPPPRNLNQQADGHYTANREPSNPEKFEVYTVKQGDTLSMIAGSVLKNPRLWPQLWEQNEHIVNPHWIYPSDKILIHPIRQITEAAPPAPAPEPRGTVTRSATPPAMPSVSAPPEAPKPNLIIDFGKARSATEIKINDLYCSGFVRKTRIPADKKVTAKYNADGGALAVTGDYIYLSGGSEDGVKVGDEYQVIRPTRKVKGVSRDPKADRDLGMHYLDVAQIHVVLAQADFAMARVTQACEAIEIGDIMFPFNKMDVPVPPRPRPFSPFMTAAGGLQGAIVMTQNALENFGSIFRASGQIPGAGGGSLESIKKGVATTGAIVYLDLGESTGVKSGDVFIVYQSVDIDPQLYKLPPESKQLQVQKTAVGELVVLKVNEAASTAIVTYSLVGLSAGDSVSRR